MKELLKSCSQLGNKIFSSKETLDILAIYGGGSQRQYYRIKENEKSAVLCRSDKIDELKEHVEISMFFQKNHIPVPEIYGYEGSLILFEDAGQVSLQSKIGKQKKDEDIWAIYKKIIDSLIELQQLNPLQCTPIRNKCFDRDYYRWETTYFLESCVEKVFELNIPEMTELLEEFDDLAKTLSLEKTVIVHRDFQSQNIYLKQDKIYFLDFQSARQGARQYDLASLLYDPYVELSIHLRQKLLNYYYEQVLIKNLIEENQEKFSETFYKISMQRLMQAMGAYGFLGIIKEKKEFLKYINPAKKLLLEACEKTKKYPKIMRLIEKIANIK